MNSERPLPHPHEPQPGGYHYPFYPQYVAYPPPPPMQQQPSGRRAAFGMGAGFVAVALVVAGVTYSSGVSNTISGSGSAVELTPSINGGGGQGGGTSNGGGTTTNRSGTANSTQQAGVVLIDSVLGYESAESAGTGMILSSDGEILTNNHVINGATSIRVTVESSGASYQADVVGTDPSEDVAVLQLRNASGLTTAKVGDASDVSDVSKGDTVTAVGNAGGAGALTTATGQVTALEQSITASDDGSGQNAERLHGLIQSNAPIIAGDSGGPLYDADGKIVGMTTAASANRVQTAAYAIPIDDATHIAGEIKSGVETTTIHIGYPGFLGVRTAAASGGVGIDSVLPDGPAAKAGITGGSVITAINGKKVTSPTELRTMLGADDPGSKVKVTWTDPSGASHHASVTLVAGPAD